jgi:hypothetical protein
MATLHSTTMRPHERKANPVRVTLFLSKATESQTIAMVAYEDGTYDILRDGIPVMPSAWKADDLDGCIDAYLRIMREHHPA